MPEPADDLPALADAADGCARPLEALGGSAADKALSDLAALRHHLRRDAGATPTVALIGGTGTGKSTLTNRLLERGEDQPAAAASYRRTHTAGPVLFATAAPPAGYLDLPAREVDQLPARGVNDALLVATLDAPVLRAVALLDAPDLDGDVPAHHDLADRAFRWADAALVVVSPEKYQLPGARGYLKLARRWALPHAVVLNKLDEATVLDDARQQLADGDATPFYVVPRDDSVIEAPAGQTLDDLRRALPTLARPREDRVAGLRRRALDWAARCEDHVVAPARDRQRRAADALAALRRLPRAEAGIDVDPLTRQLRQKLQERSVLYLVGPQRVWDRVKQLPTLLSHLPRSTADLLRGKREAKQPETTHTPRDLEAEFRTATLDSFALAQARVAELLRDGVAGEEDLLERDATWRIDPADAAAVIDAEMGELRAFVDEHTKRDPAARRAVENVLRKLPGGEKLLAASEGAPYLLVAYFLASGTLTGFVELQLAALYAGTTWVARQFTDQVLRRTRRANERINRGFAEVVARQNARAADWLSKRTPDAAAVDALAAAVERVRALAEGAPT